MAGFEGKTIRAEHPSPHGEGATVWFQNARLWRASNGTLLSATMGREDILALAHDLKMLAREMTPVGRRWLGRVPAECQVSKRPITDEFVDGALKIGGHWAIMHPDCHSYAGTGIGPGRGQRYRRTGGEWHRVEG